MNDLDSGLYLPLRFTLERSEQDRYKRHSKGVALTELNYIYLDCRTLAPFQLTYPQTSNFVSADMRVVCADNESEVDIPYVSSSWDVQISDGYSYLTYLADATVGGLSNGLFYIVVDIELSDGSFSMYSDLFMISNCDSEPYESQNFRVHSLGSGNNFRAINATDLRITK